MITEAEILKMSVKERLDLMEKIWTSLDSDDIPAPHWHEEILEARKIRLYLNRSWQCAIVRKMLHGPITAAVPASLVRRHPDVRVTMTAEVTQLPEPVLR